MWPVRLGILLQGTSVGPQEQGTMVECIQARLACTKAAQVPAGPLSMLAAPCVGLTASCCTPAQAAPCCTTSAQSVR